MKYLLDANVFITAQNTHFTLDIAPGFWEWLIRKNEAGVVYYIDKVQAELLAGEDLLAEWVEELPDSFLTPRSLRSTQAEMTALAEWVNAPERPYTEAAKRKFLGSVDMHVVATAAASDLTVVTYEVSSPFARNNVKMPDACAAIGAPCITPIKLMTDEKLRLSLAS